MRKAISIILLVVFTFMLATTSFAAADFVDSPSDETVAVASASLAANDGRPRVIISTDLEVDDLNSVIHLMLYSNEMNMIGWVVSSSQYHWNGDGKGTTLGEAVKSYRCQGLRIYADRFDSSVGSAFDPEAASLTRYRAIPMGWLENLWDNEYREAYQNLIKHAPNFPSPEYLLSITKNGNYEFEGDVRFDTEGSDLIKNALLDDDMSPLFINSWGGVNTVVRALISIAEEYKNTDEWDSVYERVCTKARIRGNGQDNSWADNNIATLFPDLVLVSNSSSYAGYGPNDLYNPNTNVGDPNYLWPTRGSAPDVNYTFQGAWMGPNIKENHGSFMARYYTFLDGQTISEEPMIYQLSITGIHDMRPQGWTPRLYDKNGFLAMSDSGQILPYIDTGFAGVTSEEFEYGKYGSGFGGVVTYRTAAGQTMISNRGISGLTGNYLNGSASGSANPFLLAVQEDFAAKADWCINDYENANHAPVISVEQNVIYAEPGEGVILEASVSDPDGDIVYPSWWIYPNGSAYSGGVNNLRVWNIGSLKTGFTVPWDAVEGDYFDIVIQGRDDDASAPMTRYSQVIVKVVSQTKINALNPKINVYPESGTITAGSSYSMTVEASNSDDGVLSYQWYTLDRDVDNAFSPIPGATDATYVAEPGARGSYYYYVTATNTIPDNGDGGAKSVYAVSHTVTLTVINSNQVSLTVAPSTVVSGDTASIPFYLSVENLYKASVIAGELTIADSRFNVNVTTDYPDATVIYNAANGKFSLFKVGGFTDADKADLMTITLTLKAGETLNNGDTLSAILNSVSFTYAFDTDSGTSSSLIENGTATTTIWKSNGIFGDLNGDGKVDGLDLAMALNVYGKLSKDADWHSSGAYLIDSNKDGLIDMTDIMIIAYLSVQ